MAPKAVKKGTLSKREAETNKKSNAVAKMKKASSHDELEAFLSRMDDADAWRRLPANVEDGSEGETSPLTAEEFAILGRLVEGNVADLDFDPYSPAVDFFTSIPQTVPLNSASHEPKRRKLPSKHEAKTVMRYVFAIRKGWIKPRADSELLTMKRKYDIWENESVADESDTKRGHRYVTAPKIPLPGHRESYRPPLEYTASEAALDKHDRQVARAKKEGTLYLGGTFKQDVKAGEDEEAPEMVKLRKFLPRQYETLRYVVGSYPFLLNDRFARCLDLYLCPRMIKNKLNIDPDDMLPKLPDLKDLRPYPNKVVSVMANNLRKETFLGTSVVQSVVFEPQRGQWLLVGEKSGRVALYDVWRSQVLQTWRLPDTAGDRAILDPREDLVEDVSDEENLANPTIVAWNPNPNLSIIAMARSGDIYLETFKFSSKEKRERSNKVLEQAYQNNLARVKADQEKPVSSIKSKDKSVQGKAPLLSGKWTLNKEGACYILRIQSGTMMLTSLNWHRKGDYFVTTQRQSSRSALYIYQLSAGNRQSPLSKVETGLLQATFHPTRPTLLILTRNKLLLLNLAATSVNNSQAIRSLDVKLATDMAIHPSGEHIVLSSMSSQLVWFDLEMTVANTNSAAAPTKTLSFHKDGTAVRNVIFHPTLPLMASCGDDTMLRITHTHVPQLNSDSKEWTEMTMKTPVIIPVKRLQAPQLVSNNNNSNNNNYLHDNSIDISRSLLALAFHPTLPWIIAAGEFQYPFLSIATQY